jgi:hypothetical protein
MGDGVGDVVAVAEVDSRPPVAREALVEAAAGEVAGHGEVRAVLGVAALLDESGGHDPTVGRDGHVERARPFTSPNGVCTMPPSPKPGSRLPSGR